jgi:hypothetical protein
VSVEYRPTSAYGSTTPARVFNSEANASHPELVDHDAGAGTAYHLRVRYDHRDGHRAGSGRPGRDCRGPTCLGRDRLAKSKSKSPLTGAAPSILKSPLNALTLGRASAASQAATLVSTATVRGGGRPGADDGETPGCCE